MVPRTFLARFFLSFLCFLVEASLVARPFYTWRQHSGENGDLGDESGKRMVIAYPDEAVLGLELLGNGEVVVDETEAGALAATELGLEAEEEHSLGILDLVHLTDLLLELGLGDVGATLVDHIDDL